MTVRRSIVAATLLWIAHSAAFGEAASTITGAGGGATLDQSVSPLSGAQIVAAKGSSTATIKVSRVVSNIEPRASGNTATFSTLSLIASAPLNKSGSDTDIASLDGLANAATLELSFGKFSFGGLRNAVPRLRELDEICARVSERARAAGVELPAGGCDSAQVQKYGDSRDQFLFENVFWNPNEKNRWIWGFSAKAGTQDFKFVEQADATKDTTNRSPWSAGGFIALNRETWKSVLTLRAQYQNAFKDADAGAVCPPGTGAPVVCATGPVGEPIEVTKKLLSFEARHAFRSFGAGLTATYDFEEEVFGVELPLHLVKDKDGNLSAGLKAGWRDDTRELTISIFVGSTFGLFD